MLRFQWNALRPGDHVLVHDDTVASLPLAEGVVVLVQTGHGANDVGIRVDRPAHQHAIVRPRQLAVHLMPLDPDEACWRCDAMPASTPEPATPAPTSAPDRDLIAS